MKRVRKFWLPDYDKHFKKWFKITNENYQMRDILKIFPYLKNFRTAIDIGAHVGFHTRILETIFNQVYAIEPNLDNVRCLRVNLNPNLGTRIIEQAVSDKLGYGSLQYSDHNSGAHKLIESGNDIPIGTIDEYHFGNEVDFIKIDVEGNEKKVLIGGSDTINNCKPVIYVENSDFGSLDKWFSKMNYKQVYSRHLEEIWIAID